MPKTRNGTIESIRVLHVARTSAIHQRSDTQRQIKALIITAPERLRALSDARLILTLATLRPDPARAGEPTCATQLALRAMAHRHQNSVRRLSSRVTGPGGSVGARDSGGSRGSCQLVVVTNRTAGEIACSTATLATLPQPVQMEPGVWQVRCCNSPDHFQ